MRILLDQNLSPKLIRALAIDLPGLESVYNHNLIGASDSTIFAGAAQTGFAAIISADLDFIHLVNRIGSPPKIIRIELSLRDHRDAHQTGTSHHSGVPDLGKPRALAQDLIPRPPA